MRSLNGGVAYTLTRRDRPIPEIRVVALRQYGNRQTAPYPTQLTWYSSSPQRIRCSRMRSTSYVSSPSVSPLSVDLSA